MKIHNNYTIFKPRLRGLTKSSFYKNKKIYKSSDIENLLLIRVMNDIRKFK